MSTTSIAAGTFNQQGKRLTAHLIHEWPNAVIKVTTRNEVLGSQHVEACHADVGWR